MPQTSFDLRVLCVALTLGYTVTGGCANGALPAVAGETPPAKISLDEPYAVYRAVLSESRRGDDRQPLVVAAETSDAAHIRDDLDRSMEFFTRRYMAGDPSRSIADGLVQAFRRVYSSHIMLDSTRLAIPNVTLLLSTEIDEVFSGDGSLEAKWEMFRQRFGAGINRLSAVGFSRDGTWALLTASESCGSLCGSGAFVLLHKTDGTWRVVTKEGVWVS